MQDETAPAQRTNYADHGAFRIWTRDGGVTLGLAIETSDPEEFAEFRVALDLAERVLRLRPPLLLNDPAEDGDWAE